jgi:Holliday junction resolvasome RuvABC DNA-binding subunit
MKTLFKTIALLLLLSCPAWAQEDSDGDDVQQRSQNATIRERIQAARVAYITEQLALTPEEAEKFWPIYREFTDKRKQTEKELRHARKNPAADKTAEENDKALVELGFKVKQQQLDLEKEYSEKLLKVIPAQKVRMLPEVEHKFRQLVLEQIKQRRQGHPDHRLRGPR